MSDPKLTYFGSVKDGRIRLSKRLRAEVAGLFEGKQIEVTFRRKRKRRSDQQNRYYWGVVVPLIVEAFIDLGHSELIQGNSESHEAVHAMLKRRFMSDGRTLEDKDGNVYELDPTTTDKTAVEMAEYMERIQEWAATCLGVTIPDPNEQLSLID